MPIIKDNDTGGYIFDSDTITDYLEDKAEIRKKVLGKVDGCPHPGPQLMERFFEFLKNAAARDGFKEQLREIDQAISNESPFVGGKDVCSYDLALAPKLYIARIGCQELKVGCPLLHAALIK